MEMIISAIFRTSVTQDLVGRSHANWPVVTILKRRWAAYLTRQVEETARAQLRSMSDRELKEIGLTRAEIPRAVRGGVERDRAFIEIY
jgi:uncharacterized protein YjiS (DUF1127 family)